MKKKYLILPSVLLIIFIVLALIVKVSPTLSIDNSVSNFILSHQNNYLLNFSKIIGIIFDTIPMIVLSLIISVFLFIKSKPKEALYFASASIITGALIYVLKDLIARPRPVLQAVQETSFAFPSGHATISIVFFGLLTLFAFKHMKSKKQKILSLITSLVLILIAGLTRIYLNVHWLTDVIGGYLLGATILTTFIYFYKKD
ncbi:Undecaprenyl-diphosphatase [uncultured archaeon]|nr:Undecaprenyl-diphosphatase [uncultured archaeon]